MRVAGLFAACVVASVSGEGIAADSVGPVTLVSDRLPIVSFAQDGDRIAWIGQVKGQCDEGLNYEGPASVVYGRASAGGAVTRLFGPWCRAAGGELAVAGRRVLFTNTWYGNNTYTQVMTAEIGGAAVHLEGRLSSEHALFGDADGSGSYFGALAGDGDVLAYSVIGRAYNDDCDLDFSETCHLTAGGRVSRVEGRAARRVPGFGGAVALAVSAPNIVSIPVAASTYSEARLVGPTDTTVVVRNARTGRMVTSFKPIGVPREVALTPALVAVLAEGGLVRRIELRHPRTGSLRRNVPVPRGARGISAAGRTVVYSVGRYIYALDSLTFAIRRVARAAVTPIGLSIDGKRIAWIENVRGHGAIRAIYLP